MSLKKIACIACIVMFELLPCGIIGNIIIVPLGHKAFFPVWLHAREADQAMRRNDWNKL